MYGMRLSRWSLALVFCAVPVACASSNGEAENEPRIDHWDCQLTDTACSCEGLPPGTISFGSNHVEACFGYPCCLLSEEDPEAPTCACLETTNCAAEAATRPGATPVAQCPPDAKPPACAAPGENCRYDYLATHDLAGCCTGTICAANADGVPVCQAATEQQTAYATQCAHDAMTRNDALKVVSGPLRTSIGDIVFDTAKYAFATVGPSGCLNDLDVTFEQGSSCTLDFETELLNGALEVTSGFSNLGGCPGFQGDSLDGYVSSSDPLNLELTFDTVACDGQLIFESYCVSGRFDWHISGQGGSVVFEDQHLIAEGTVCGSEPMGACPTL
jgi:hypothetical protein